MDDIEKKRRAMALLVALGAAASLPDANLAGPPRRGSNRGGVIVCAYCGQPTRQRDRSALGDSSGICPACAAKLRARRR